MTVRLAADVIARYRGRIVLVERKYPPYGLALPGGHHDEGETLEETAARELREETGLLVRRLSQLRTYSDPGRDPRGHYISTVFVADAYGTLSHGSDAKGTRLVGIGEIDGLRDRFAFDHYVILRDYLDRTDIRPPA